MSIKKIVLSLIISFLYVASAQATLTVTVANKSTLPIKFVFPNNVSFGPVAPNTVRTLPNNLTAKLAGKSGLIQLESGQIKQFCGPAAFYNGRRSATRIEIHKLDKYSVTCVLTTQQ